MNTDTPETDGEWNRLACQDHPEFERNLADFARKLERERDELRRTNEGLRLTFDLRWKADQRAIKRWQAAHPGNDLTWPDHSDMVVWLMEQTRNEELERERDQWRNEHDRVVREYQHRLVVIGISVIDATSYPENA